MKTAVWTRALKASAEPQRARHYLDALAATSASDFLKDASAEQARILGALFSGSLALSNYLVAHPALVSTLTPESLHHPRRDQGLRREVEELLAAPLQAADFSAALSRLREFKQAEMLRVAARDLARLANVTEITRELSDVADVCLDTVLRVCRQQLQARLGRPWHQDGNSRWQPTEFCVFGLGKLGGQELNYSSDVDVIFVYSEEGQVFQQPPKGKKPAGGGMTSHQFFNRLAESFVAEVGRMAGEGMLYRIDLRLRPEGDAGPLSRSLAGYENYYAQWGQTWERMMLLKARRTAGDAAVASEFLELVQPFRYPRSPDELMVREVAAMKDRIEKEVVRSDELDRNVKLGRGGIREIEFIAQTEQLLHAGRMPFLQGSQTLPTLDKLVQYELLPQADARALTEAYCFLRDVEHRLQMEDNQQTHTIPDDASVRTRLAALMGFTSPQNFEKARAEHSRAVRRVYDRLLKGAGPARTPMPMTVLGAEAEWQTILAGHGFQNIAHSVKLLGEFAHGPGYVHVSQRTSELALRLLAKFLALCPQPDVERPEFDPGSHVLSDPDRVLTRLDTFISAYGARATLYETWNSNPSLFELLLLLFDRSEFLAETAIHTPDLVDELVLSGRLRQRKTSAQILADLRHGLDDADQRLWLRRYHQAEQMRIGLRDILGLADFESNLAELSCLADACLQYALESVLRQHKLKRPPLAIIGLGKLGGQEINYGSDLDIVFVTAAPVRELPKLQRLAVEVMDLLSSRTEMGIAFETDARLRPDGEKGLLVNTLDAYEDYYRKRAQLWEIQSISRTRPIAGDVKLGEKFQALVKSLTDFRPVNVANHFAPGDGLSGSGLAAYTPKWREQIHHMRQRIEKERTPPGQDTLAIKTGAGGLVDAEFLAQMFCLANGWQEANTLKALERARDAGVLSGAEAHKLLENYRQLRRLEGILRRWSFEGETVLPAEDAPYYRVAIRCGFSTPEQFRSTLAKWRQEIREVYNKAFCK